MITFRRKLYLEPGTGDAGGASPSVSTPNTQTAPAHASPTPAASPAPAGDPIDRLIAADDARQAAAQTTRTADILPAPTSGAAPAPTGGSSTPPSTPLPAPTPTPAVPTASPLTPAPDQLSAVLQALNTNFGQLTAAIKPPTPVAPVKPIIEQFNLTAADMDAVIEGGDAALGVFKKVYEKAIIDSAMINQALMQKQVAEQYTPVLQPMIEYYQKQQVQQAADRFFSKYEDLKPVAELANDVAGRLIQSGFKADNLEAFQEKVASVTRGYFQAIQAKPTAGATPAAGGPPPPPPQNAGAPIRGPHSAPMGEDKKLMEELQKDAGVTSRK